MCACIIEWYKEYFVTLNLWYLLWIMQPCWFKSWVGMLQCPDDSHANVYESSTSWTCTAAVWEGSVLGFTWYPHEVYSNLFLSNPWQVATKVVSMQVCSGCSSFMQGAGCFDSHVKPNGLMHGSIVQTMEVLHMSLVKPMGLLHMPLVAYVNATCQAHWAYAHGTCQANWAYEHFTSLPKRHDMGSDQ